MQGLSDNLPDLFVFIKVVDLKSFSAAARACGSTKSTVSKQVRRLEDALGAKLLNRTTRHLGLTEAGQLAYQHGVRIAEETSALRSSIDGLQDTPRGHLRVTTSVAFGNLHLTRLVGQFLAQYPEIGVTLTLSDRSVDVVEEGYDVAIRLTSSPIDSVVARRLASFAYLVCAAPAYLRCHAAIQAPADLAAHNCVINGAAREASWRFVRDGVASEVAVAGRLAVNGSESCRVALQAGVGVGLLPSFAIGDDIQAKRLTVLLPQYTPEGPFGNSIYAIFPPSRYGAPKLRVFVDFLVAAFANGVPPR